MHSPKNNLWNLALTLLVPAACLWLMSCSSRPNPSKSYPTVNPATYAESEPFAGQTVVDAITCTNTVVSIDAAQRRIELKHADGKITSYKCGPDIRNFDQIKVGDEVKATVVQEIAVYLKPASATQTLAATGRAVGARVGAKPGVVSLDTLDFTARIAAIDPWQHQVTLQTADGRTRPITVSEFINLADFNVGDEVRVRLTQALAVLVEKP
jgi:hypothetical protein